MVDRVPAAIAQCTGVADVQAAVRFARENGIPVSVRGGGHGTAGTAVCDDGLMIDLEPMKGIVIDPGNNRARAEGGVTWGQLDRETQVFGLATTGGLVSSTGIAGLTLGGGLGWLMRKHGLACDNLRSATVVLADGTPVMASETENGDLFWALRGGGGNFGVVTSFEYHLHPVGPLLAGMLIHPAAATREVLRAYRAFSSTAPDELTAYAALLTAPDGSPVVALLVCYCGPIAKGEVLLRPLVEFGSPLANTIAPMPYTSVQQQLDGAYPKGALNYWKSSFLDSLSDDVIEVVSDHFARVPSAMTAMVFEHLGGAVGRVPVEATAFAHRQSAYNLVITSVWQDRDESPRNIAWTRGLFAAVQPHAAAGVYVNYLDEDDVAGRSVSAFGANYARLQAVKAKYDPANFFAQNQNVLPR
jgi:FAD/FMN-containing dehydrogenase